MAFKILDDEYGNNEYGNNRHGKKRTFGNVTTKTTLGKSKASSPVTTPKVTTPTYYSGGSSSGDYYEEPYDYAAYLEQLRQQRIAAQKAIIDQQVAMAKRQYEERIPEVEQGYQDLKNQSEVERYKAQKTLRESQANRGALDSGTGRQETLTLQNNYGNNLNSINEQEQNELNTIKNAISDVVANGEIAKAQADIDGMGDMSSFINSNLSSLQDMGSGYRTAASNVVARAQNSQPTSSTNSNAISYSGYNGKAKTASSLNLLRERLTSEDLRKLLGK